MEMHLYFIFYSICVALMYNKNDKGEEEEAKDDDDDEGNFVRQSATNAIMRMKFV